MILIRVPFLWVTGIALYPFVLIKNKKPSKSLLFHEKIHLKQQLEMLIIPFYIWYLTEFLIYYLKYQNGYIAYMNISFEKEAYANDANYDYLLNRSFWAFLKYIK